MVDSLRAESPGTAPSNVPGPLAEANKTVFMLFEKALNASLKSRLLDFGYKSKSGAARSRKAAACSKKCNPGAMLQFAGENYRYDDLANNKKNEGDMSDFAAALLFEAHGCDGRHECLKLNSFGRV